MNNDDKKFFESKYRTRFIEMFRERREPESVTHTDDYKRVSEQIKACRAALDEAVEELRIMDRAWNSVAKDEGAARCRRDSGVSDEITALVEEVYERCQQATSLQGYNRAPNHRVPQAYADIKRWTLWGTFGRSKNFDGKPIKHDPLYISKWLMRACLTVMQEDNTKKGLPLYERVNRARVKAEAAWSVAGSPTWTVIRNNNDSAGALYDTTA